VLTEADLTTNEAAELKFAMDSIIRAGAGQQQQDNTRRNKLLAFEYLRKPRSQRPLGFAAGITNKGKRPASSADSVRYWSQTREERDAEDANLAKETGLEITEVRRLLSESHPDHGGSNEQFIAAKKKLDSLRKKK